MAYTIAYSQRRKYRFERRLIYLYFFFLIFEGAFRKWILPEYSSLFVVIRDPIVLLLVIIGLFRGWLKNSYCIISIGLSLFSYAASFSLDPTNPLIQYYGTRIFLLYFPAIFVMSKVLTVKDVYTFGKYCVYLSIPMTLLIVIQYFSPQNAWVNLGVGGDLEGSGFGGSMGYYRPAGIFSFTQGFTTFQSVVLTYILTFFYNKKARKLVKISRLILIVALICYLISIPVSISRTVLFQTVGIFLCLIFGLLITKRKQIGNTIFFFILLACAIWFLSTIPDVQLFLDVYLNRFAEASEREGAIVNGTIGERYFGAFLRAWDLDVPFWGHGIGLETRLALTYFPNMSFVTDEEWSRIIYESGFLLGTAYILLRVVLSISLTIKSIIRTHKASDISPMLLLPSVLYLLPQGPLGNAVPLGFMTLLTAMLITMLKNTR